MTTILKYAKEPITWIIVVMFLIITYIVSMNVDEVLGHMGFDSKSKLRAEVATLKQDNNLLRAQLENLRRQAESEFKACNSREVILIEYIDNDKRIDDFIKGVIKDTSNILLNPETVKLQEPKEEPKNTPLDDYDRILLTYNTLFGG